MSIAGSLVALVTPMTAQGLVDEAAFDALLDYQHAGGIEGVVLGGTTGESPTLTPEELAALVGRARRRLPAHVQVVAGSGTNDTNASLALTHRVFDAGADACMLVTPYYNKPTQGGLRRHFEAIADVAAGPVLLYNVPGRTGCDLLPATVAALAGHPRVAGVKEALPDMARIRELRRLCDSPFRVLSGDDATLVEALEAGADGAVSVTGNVAPRQLRAMVAAAGRGEPAQARAIDRSLRDLHAALFVESNPIPVKWALKRLGVIPDDTMRLPMTPLDPVHQPLVERALHAASLL